MYFLRLSFKIDYNIQGAIEFLKTYFMLLLSYFYFSVVNEQKENEFCFTKTKYTTENNFHILIKIKLYPVSFSAHNTLKIFV